MALSDSALDLKNPYTFQLTLLSPKGKSRSLERVLYSLTEWVDPSFQIINVEERLDNEKTKMSKSPSKLKQIGKLVTPALSVMLFVQETGAMCVRDVENILKRPPWSFHHKVELQNKNLPHLSLAKQEFYKLAKDLPLWAACPVATADEHLRINIYVHRFKAMVEFYRAVTEVEIETEKPEFCIFQLYQQPGLDIQLSLKFSQYIYPVPTESAFISFNVSSIETVKLGTRCDIRHVGGNVFTTRDPDGNRVVLYEQLKIYSKPLTSSRNLASTSSNRRACNIPSTSISGIELLDDVKSLKSSSDSHDSGRCSDSDGPLVDNVFSSESDVRNSDCIKKERVRMSEGYSSSVGSFQDTLPSQYEVRGNNLLQVSESPKGKAPKRFSFFGKGKAKTKESSSNDSDKKKEVLDVDIAPVFI